MIDVEIDGHKYVPREETPLNAEANALLSEVYGTLWMEAHYDPSNATTQKFSKPLADKMWRLNQLLKFKP